MRLKSHCLLGEYLAQKYMQRFPHLHIQAFLFGCTQPDHNPATYIKGSLRCQMLRGHNYPNARRFMERLALRLEQKQKFSLLDCYSLGKLIHYTADAFTRAHNADFPDDLEQHRAYEEKLQHYYLNYLTSMPSADCPLGLSGMQIIKSAHRKYLQQPPCIENDTRWSIQVCSCLTAKLTGTI